LLAEQKLYCVTVFSVAATSKDEAFSSEVVPDYYCPRDDDDIMPGE